MELNDSLKLTPLSVIGLAMLVCAYMTWRSFPEPGGALLWVLSPLLASAALASWGLLRHHALRALPVMAAVVSILGIPLYAGAYNRIDNAPNLVFAVVPIFQWLVLLLVTGLKYVHFREVQVTRKVNSRR